MPPLPEVPPPQSSPRFSRKWALSIAFAVLVVTSLAMARLTSPREPGFRWEPISAPPMALIPDSLVGSASGFAVLSGMTPDGVVLWLLEEGDRWEPLPLSGAPSQLAPFGDGLIAYGARTGRVVRSEGGEWRESDPLVFPGELRSRQESGRPSVVGDGEAIVAMTLAAELWWAVPGGDFQRVIAAPEWGPGTERGTRSSCRPPTRNAPDVPPVAVGDDGYLAMVSRDPEELFGLRPVCEPRIWASTDGREWGVTSSFAGGGTYVYDLAWRDGIFVAVGGTGIGEPGAWSSGDGLAWESIEAFGAQRGVDLFSVEGGDAGWLVLGRGQGTSRLVGWTSTDGSCWEPLPGEVGATDGAVSVAGILAIERGTPPSMWLGKPTGAEGVCR